MTIDDIKELALYDIHSLADKFTKGEIPFSLAKEYVRFYNTPPLIMMAYLNHPECTIMEYKTYYYNLVKKTGDIAKNTILTKAPILKNISVLAYVLHAEGNTLKDIARTYEVRKPTFAKLAKNPHVSDEYKLLYYELSGDGSLLPDDLKTIFFK